MGARAKLVFRVSALVVAAVLILGGLALEWVRSTLRKARHYDAAVERMKSNDAAGAVGEFTKAIEADPSFGHAYRGRGLALTTLEKFDEAQADLDKAVELGAGDADVHFARGLHRDHHQKHRQAVAEYSRCIELSDPRGYSARAESRFKAGDRKGALEDAHKALELDSTNPRLLFLRCKILIKLHRLHEARKDVEAVLARLPDQPLAFYYRAQIRAGLGDSHGADSDMARLMELDPKAPSPFYRIGMGEDPIVKTTAAIEKNASDWAAYRGRANAWMRDRDFEAAEADLTVLIEAGQATATDWCSRGQARAALFKTAEALSDFKRAVELDPTEPQFRYPLAVAQCDGGEYEAAQENFLRCGEQKVEFDRCALRLWWVRSRLNKREAARSECGFYVDQSRRNGNFGWPVRLLEFLAGRCTEDELLMSIKTMGLADGLRGQGYFYVGCRRLLDGDKAGAARWFQECIETSATTDEATSAAIELNRLK